MFVRPSRVRQKGKERRDGEGDGAESHPSAAATQNGGEGVRQVKRESPLREDRTATVKPNESKDNKEKEEKEKEKGPRILRGVKSLMMKVPRRTVAIASILPSSIADMNPCTFLASSVTRGRASDCRSPSKADAAD
jgi:hypothetical protein